MKYLAVVAILVLATFIGAEPTESATTQMLGPIPYKSFQDSPFNGVVFVDSQLENFEDHLFNVTGVSANNGIVTSTQFFGSIIDSVDGDDGNPNNGSCLGCDSYFGSSGPQGITFTFNPLAPGGLPTHAGIVWTDGVGTTSFEAFDRAGRLVGAVGPVAIADVSFLGTTAEDHFFGVIHTDGVLMIRISNTQGGIEVDHLQFGHITTCVDFDRDGFGSPGAAACQAGSDTDCDDQDPFIFPGAREIYDGLDGNCNGLVDEGLDDDQDGIPNFLDLCPQTSSGSGVDPGGCPVCQLEDDDDDEGDDEDDDDRDVDGDGFSARMDCNSGNAGVNPGATEVCNGIDDNCDGRVDEEFDQDRDGFRTCDNDCDDLDARIHPGAVDVPGNTVDENCDGSRGKCDPERRLWEQEEFSECITSECSELTEAGSLTTQQCRAIVEQAISPTKLRR